METHTQEEMKTPLPEGEKNPIFKTLVITGAIALFTLFGGGKSQAQASPTNMPADSTERETGVTIPEYTPAVEATDLKESSSGRKIFRTIEAVSKTVTPSGEIIDVPSLHMSIMATKGQLFFLLRRRDALANKTSVANPTSASYIFEWAEDVLADNKTAADHTLALASYAFGWAEKEQGRYVKPTIGGFYFDHLGPLGLLSVAGGYKWKGLSINLCAELDIDKAKKDLWVRWDTQKEIGEALQLEFSVWWQKLLEKSPQFPFALTLSVPVSKSCTAAITGMYNGKPVVWMKAAYNFQMKKQNKKTNK